MLVTNKKIFLLFLVLFLLSLFSYWCLNSYKLDRGLSINNSLIRGNYALVFEEEKEGFVPALYYYDSQTEIWELFAKKEDFVCIQDNSDPNKTIAKNFERVHKASGNNIIATAVIKHPLYGKYKFILNVRLQEWNNKPIFMCDYSVENEKPATNVTIPIGFLINSKVKDSYYFSPGIFYKDNEQIPLKETSDINIPTLSRILKDESYTFLANRPMLPLIANWSNDKMVMLATTDTTDVDKIPVRNSLGWKITDNNHIEQITWINGFLVNRYMGSDSWTENINSNTDGNKISSFSKRFYLAIEKGDVWSLFDYFRIFRQHYRDNLEKNIYESMLGSLDTKLTYIDDWYNSDEGRLLHTAGANDQLTISWVGGVPSGYGMLLLADTRKDEKLYKASVNTIDFIANNGLSPSGFSYNWYRNGKWDYKGIAHHPQYTKGIPARLVTEAVFYILEAYKHELDKGIAHDNWLDYAKSNLDAAVAVWQKNNDFGYEYSEQEVDIVRGDTPSAILWIGALALGYDIIGDKEYLKTATQAAEYYYEKFISKALIYAGEWDQDFAPDASSSAHAMAAYYTLYNITKNEKYLNYAKKAADIYSTYVVGYNMMFDDSSKVKELGWTSLGLSTSGARNNHITSGCWPGFISYLVDIYYQTKEVYYGQVASDQYQAALQGYARSDSDIVGVSGMGKIKKGYGFDWIVHSDFCGGLAEKGFWFGGLRHLGMFHQTYIPALNWITTQRDYGSVIIDYNLKNIISFDSLVITESVFKKNIQIKAYNAGTNDETYKIFICNLPYGDFDIYQNKKKIGSVRITKDNPNAFFNVFCKSKEFFNYKIVPRS